MAEVNDVRPRPKVCTHCEGYAAQTFTKEDPVTHAITILSTDLCGNCYLIPPAERAARKAADKRRAEILKQADAEAKKAYHDAIQRANSNQVAAVTGDDDKARRKEAAK